MARSRWVGIDEAGYGPNLGPLVMTAVIAESIDDREPDLWADLEGIACRAGGPADRVWIDDSKAVLATRDGRWQLERSCLSAIDGAGLGRPEDLTSLIGAVGAGDLAHVELDRWLPPPAKMPDAPGGMPKPSRACARPLGLALRESARDSGRSHAHEDVGRPRAKEPLLGCHAWRLVSIRSVVMGPARFNEHLQSANSKAIVHFGAFAELIEDAWEKASDGIPTRIRGDKHGGRNFYAGPLSDALPDSWVAPEVEGPALSRYAIRSPGRDVRIEFCPRADAADGLVALASIVSKTLRELWMDAFNSFWIARLPGLKPTAGYPVDARRYRRAIEPLAMEQGLHPSLWWRER